MAIFCCHYLETKTFPFDAALETSSQQRESVVHGGSAETRNDHMKAIFGLGAGAGIVSDLKRVSVECDEVVEMRNDCLMESDVAHEICRDDHLGHDLGRHLGRKYLAHGGVVGTVVD